MQKSQSDLLGITGVGSDGSYSTKGQGTSAFVIQRDNVIVHTHSFLVVAHSSFDVEMQVANAAIDYIVDNTQGPVLMFIDNQATLRSLFSTKLHTAFQLALMNSKNMFKWVSLAPDNMIEFRWMPCHLGFALNELADKAAEQTPIGPPAFPHHSLASLLRKNRSLVINEWRLGWHIFAESKELKLKKKKCLYMPNAWDGKGKQFTKLAHNITLFSRFTRLISGHAPTGKYHQCFFPQEPRGCTCFEEFQSRSHLLVECPKYTFKFSYI